MKLLYTVDQVSTLAELCHYEVFSYQSNIGLLSVVKGRVKVQIYLSRMTVGIPVTRRGRKVMQFYKKVDLVRLQQLLREVVG